MSHLFPHNIKMLGKPLPEPLSPPEAYRLFAALVSLCFGELWQPTKARAKATSASLGGRNEGKMGRGRFTPCHADETYQLATAPQAAPGFTWLFGQQGPSAAAPTEGAGGRGRPAEQATLLLPWQRKNTCLQNHWP